MICKQFSSISALFVLVILCLKALLSESCDLIAYKTVDLVEGDYHCSGISVLRQETGYATLTFNFLSKSASVHAYGERNYHSHLIECWNGKVLFDTFLGESSPRVYNYSSWPTISGTPECASNYLRGYFTPFLFEPITTRSGTPVTSRITFSNISTQFSEFTATVKKNPQDGQMQLHVPYFKNRY